LPFENLCAGYGLCIDRQLRESGPQALCCGLAILEFANRCRPRQRIPHRNHLPYRDIALAAISSADPMTTSPSAPFAEAQVRAVTTSPRMM
jgi:hypothetical protein